MNILLLTHSYPDKTNSWRGTFIKEQAIALSSVHNVIVVYFRIDYKSFLPFSSYSFTKLANKNLAEYELVINRSFPVINQVNYLYKSYRFLVSEILPGFKPDIVHSHLSYPAGLLGAIIQSKKGIPNILTEHSRITNYFRSWFHKRCVIYTLNDSSGIIAVSNSLKDEIAIIANRQISVIHNIVDTDRFKPCKRIKGASLNIGFLGGLGNNNKGLDILLKAASSLQDKNFFLHIGGNGILLENYKKLASDYKLTFKCKFYGDIPRDEISGFYSMLDIFVLPSRYETFGIVLIEAMSCGIPVIATNCGGPQEIVSAENGLLIEKDNVPALTNAIEKMAVTYANYDPDSIRSTTEKRFGTSAIIEKITAVYRDVLLFKNAK